MRITSIHKMLNVPNEIFQKDWPLWYKESKQLIKGFCIYCGNELPKRKRTYCSVECKLHSRCAIQDLQVSSLRRYIHKWFDFECQDCGLQFKIKTPSGVLLPLYWGEVHHIIPLKYGGRDSFENLILLCNNCHKQRHR